ncbi:Putative DNA processing protein DprA [Streptomyces sp. enrichment culture]
MTSGLSAGVHQLLRGEGIVVTDAAEIVELVGAIGELAPERRGPMVPRDLLSPEAACVLEALPARGALGVGAVARAAALAEDRALVRLQELQSLGFLERNGDYWQLARAANQHTNR